MNADQVNVRYMVENVDDAVAKPSMKKKKGAIIRAFFL